MFIKLITIGWGWVLPFNGIAERVSSIGNELKVEIEAPVFPRLKIMSVKWTNINGKGNVIDLYQVNYGGEIRIYRGGYFIAELGGYYLIGNIREKEERSYGVGSYYGIKLKTYPISFQFGYSSVIQGINVGVNVRIK
jgi:hypothetical protein